MSARAVSSEGLTGAGESNSKMAHMVSARVLTTWHLREKTRRKPQGHFWSSILGQTHTHHIGFIRSMSPNQPTVMENKLRPPHLHKEEISNNLWTCLKITTCEVQQLSILWGMLFVPPWSCILFRLLLFQDSTKLSTSKNFFEILHHLFPLDVNFCHGHRLSLCYPKWCLCVNF